MMVLHNDGFPTLALPPYILVVIQCSISKSPPFTFFFNLLFIHAVSQAGLMESYLFQ